MEVRARFAELVLRLLPPTAPNQSIRAVAEASGYSRDFIDKLRFQEHPWQRPATAKRVVARQEDQA